MRTTETGKSPDILGLLNKSLPESLMNFKGKLSLKTLYTLNIQKHFSIDFCPDRNVFQNYFNSLNGYNSVCKEGGISLFLFLK